MTCPRRTPHTSWPWSDVCTDVSKAQNETPRTGTPLQPTERSSEGMGPVPQPASLDTALSVGPRPNSDAVSTQSNTAKPYTVLELPDKPKKTSAIKHTENDMAHMLSCPTKTPNDQAVPVDKIEEFTVLFFRTLQLAAPSRRKKWRQMTTNQRDYLFANTGKCVEEALKTRGKSSTFDDDNNTVACDNCVKGRKICARHVQHDGTIVVKWHPLPRQLRRSVKFSSPLYWVTSAA
jgi:hypothetical protein